MPFDLAATQRTRSTFLARRASLVLDGAEGTIINVDSGCLWITLESDPRDIVLFKGMRFEVDRTGRTVIVAEEDSRLRLTPAPTFVQRIVNALAPTSKRALAGSIKVLEKQVACRRVPYF